MLYQQLLARNVEAFFPEVQVNPVNPRARKRRPYFPNYLFVHADLGEDGISFFQWMPYSQGLVTFGGEPATVPDALIYALQNKLAEIILHGGENLNDFSPGEKIRVVDGCLRGFDGIFDTSIDGKDRVRVLMNILNNRQVLVELGKQQIASVT